MIGHACASRSPPNKCGLAAEERAKTSSPVVFSKLVATNKSEKGWYYAWHMAIGGLSSFSPHHNFLGRKTTWADCLPDSFRGGYVKPEGHDAKVCFVRPDNPQSKCPGVNLRLIVYCIIGDV
jgi:hypothetical protein